MRGRQRYDAHFGFDASIGPQPAAADLLQDFAALERLGGRLGHEIA